MRFVWRDREVFYHLIAKVSFYHLRVTLKEQHANSIRALMSSSDWNKTCGHMRIIQNEYQV